MYRRFLYVNTGNASKIFDTHVESDTGGASETYQKFFWPKIIFGV